MNDQPLKDSRDLLAICKSDVSDTQQKPKGRCCIDRPGIQTVMAPPEKSHNSFPNYTAVLTMENIAVHPLGIEKESGIIVTKPRGRHISYPKATFWHYTLQITIFEKQDNKVIVSLTAVDVGSNGSPPDPGWTEMRRYFNDSIANDAEAFFNQLDNLLGKAEYYRPGKVLFPL